MLSQEEMLSKKIKQEKRKSHNQLLLRCLIMSLVVYILFSPVIIQLLNKNIIIKKNIGINLFRTILFCVLYYILHIIFI